MSYVDFEKIPLFPVTKLPMSYVTPKNIPMLYVDFRQYPMFCHLQLFYSLISKAQWCFDFEKWLCRHVEFRHQGLSQGLAVASRECELLNVILIPRSNLERAVKELI